MYVGEKKLPKDYHCTCKYCKQVIGELIRPDGTHYSRLARRKYYSKAETASTKDPSGHIAKTPLHIARWAIQAYTRPGDWVLDPTVGAGTTIVESLTHGRNAVGVEIQFVDVVAANAEHVVETRGLNAKWAVAHGDARDMAKHLKELGVPKPFQLVVNNPPYWGDQSQKGVGAAVYAYDKSRANLAFLKEGPEYYDTLRVIYGECVKAMALRGHLVIGVKDQMRNKVPDQLHEKIGDVIASIPGIQFVGAAVLKHYPTTLFINTYEQRTGVKPPMYQSILVFQKVKK